MAPATAAPSGAIASHRMVKLADKLDKKGTLQSFFATATKPPVDPLTKTFDVKKEDGDELVLTLRERLGMSNNAAILKTNDTKAEPEKIDFKKEITQIREAMQNK